MERLEMKKHTRLLRTFINYGRKSFITLDPGTDLAGLNNKLSRWKKYKIGPFLKFSAARHKPITFYLLNTLMFN
jgi:hypothetical protein